MLWYGLEPLAKAAPDAFTRLASETRIPLLRKFIARRVTEEIERQPALANRLLESVGKSGDTKAKSDVLDGMGLALRGWRKAPKPACWDTVSSDLIHNQEPQIRERATELAALFGDGRALDDLRQLSLNERADPAARRSALETLINSHAPNLLPVVLKLLTQRDMARSAAHAVGNFDDPDLASRLIGDYNHFRGEVRTEVISVLASRANYARALLEAVAAGKVPRRDISAYHARQMHAFGDKQLDHLLEEQWGELKTSSEEKQRQIAALRLKMKPELIKAANLKKGHELFLKTCGVCHRLYGEGASIGPDLTGSGRKDLGYLVENIIEPSAVVAADYKMSFVEMKDGRVLTGLVGEKRERTLTIQTLTDKIVVDRNDIESIQPSSLSLMPEGLLGSMNGEEQRDLFGYLMTSSQP
jgi:putative heme-binding domain-containing protein